MRNSCARQRLVNLWDDSVVVARVWILNGQPGFQKEPLVIIRLMSNYTDGIKIHMMVVLMDMPGDLRVMVEHGNCPFVFRNPGL